jgi:ceramide glucosyltransferase
VGQLFTIPLPLAVLLWAVQPVWWPLAAATLVLRAIAGVFTAGYVLRDGLTARLCLLVPVQDVLSLGMWVAGFFGNTILWRGRKYYLRADGRFELVAE